MISDDIAEPRVIDRALATFLAEIDRNLAVTISQIQALPPHIADRPGAEYLTFELRPSRGRPDLQDNGRCYLLVVPAGAPKASWEHSNRAVTGRGRAPEMLSRRERETLSYIARGFTHQQTATRMGVSKATVDTYVARVRAKLNLGNKAELAIAALRV
jgi:DNA-binding CsgD family transcriptional regulator